MIPADPGVPGAEPSAPEPLPRTAFCAAGHAASSAADLGDRLLRAHEAGELRLIDAGQEAESGLPRRWRASWGRGSTAVRAALVVARGPGAETAFWVHAEAARPWSIRDQVSPVQRLGLLEHDPRDPRGAYSLTEQNPLVGLEDVEFLVHTFAGGVRDSPVLVFHGDLARPMPPELLRFRAATKGLCGLLPVDDSVRERVNALLPEDRWLPARAARLYLPSWWAPHLDDPVVPGERFGRPGEWRKLVDIALRVSSWRAGGAIRMTGGAWRALLVDPMHDRRVAPGTRGGALRWLPAADDGGARVLRDRLGTAARQEELARDRADSSAAELAERRAGLRRLRDRAGRAERSRRRLAELAGRLRRQRDEAESALRSGSVLATVRAAREAELEAALHAEELDAAEDELLRLRHRVAELERLGSPEPGPDAAPPEPVPEHATFAELLATARRELPALRFGPQVDPSALDGHRRSGQWLRRTWNVLVLLDSYARDRAGAADPGRADLRGFAHYVRAHGGERGISPALVASGESELVVNTPRFRTARTFPVPAEVEPAGHAFFGAHVRIDRGGGVAPRLHYVDDSRGATASIHIGHLGPHLPGPESN
ncbi:hypothetical protein ACL03H_06940 [Saccharopolyspora sp. MS10]|uniref:hypothetical protein n=1 Tax=Saccharopolyspora sp. MS10 TaxID=3385973 RepID=UPI0039A2FB91